MSEGYWWIPEINNRITTGVVYFFILLLWGKGTRRPGWAARLVLSFLALVCVSWVIRFVLETYSTTVAWRAFGYVVHTLAMLLLFTLCYALCWKAPGSEYFFRSLFAYVVFKLAWYTQKAVAALLPIYLGRFP